MPDACLNPNDLRVGHRADAAHRTSNPTFVGCLLLALYGCASIAPRQTVPITVDVPAAWSTADVSTTTGNPSLAQWWSRFDDRLLSSLVTQALRANTSVKSAEAALRQARALRDVSAAALWPTVGGSALAQHSTSGRNGASNSFTARLDASWELDIFGANRSALEASDATALASAASLGDVQVSIADDLALSIPAETLRQRPGVRAAEDQVTAAVARVARADAALAPNFKLGGLLGLNALTLGALTSGASVVSALVAGASVDLSADHVRLYKALGGGWRPDGGDATPASNNDAPRTPRS